MSKYLISASRFLLALVAASALPAQSPDRGIVEVGNASMSRSNGDRSGLYGTIGLGAGRESYKYADETHFTEPLSKPTLTLRLGGTPSPRARVGAELFAWSNDINGGTEHFGTLLMTGQYYVGKKGGLFIKGGVGFSRSGASYHDAGSAYETGVGVNYGIGWDLPVGPNVSFSPTIEMYSGSFSRRNDATITEHVVNIGMQVTLQGGRR